MNGKLRLAKFLSQQSKKLTKIGVFDSGLGGLSVLNEALLQAPGHDYLYLADSANAPYGEKSSQWLELRSLAMCQWLAQQGCEAIVVACNTATASAIASIREALPDIALIGVEPGIKPAAIVSSKKIVGVLATENTLKSDKFRALLATLPSDYTFIQQAGIGLVPLIEEGHANTSEMDALLMTYLNPMLKAGADTLVLGCTHYPFLINQIKKLSLGQLNIVDTSEAIVRQMRRLVADSTDSDIGQISFLSTANGDELLKHAQQLMTYDFKKHPIHAQTVTIC